MDTPISYQDFRQTTGRLFFIVGTSRSGSTLLQSMLNTHSKIAIPPETHFFKTAYFLKKKYHDNHKTEFRNKLINFWYDQKTRIRDLGLTKEQVLKNADELNLYTPLDLFILQMTMYRKERGKQISGEKTPRHILHVKQILRAFPQAKIISLFRDPRAAAYSEIKAYFGSPSVTVTTRRWRKYVTMHNHLQESLPADQYTMLRYNDLIADPEGILKQLTEFLDLTYEKQMLNYYNRNETGFAEGEEGWKAETLKPLKKNKNEDWKTGLSGWQVALIEQWAGDYLHQLGYKSAHPSPGLIRKGFFQLWDMAISAWSTVTNDRYEGYVSPKKFKV